MSEPEGENGGESVGESPATEQPASKVSSKPPPPSGPAAEGEPTVEDRLATTQAEAARLRDQLLRTAADFDNFRKRSRREVEDAQRRGKESALKELLPVFDNLERAATHAEGSADAKSVVDGLRIVLKQFVDTLGRLGVKRIPTVGLPFDPSVHEAIQHLESTEHPAGVIVAEIQPAYMIGEQLLRPAMVVVSKGPPS